MLKKLLLPCLVLFLFLLPAQPAKAAPPTNFQKSLIIGTGLDGPTGFQIAPDGRIFILQRTGEVKIFKNGALLPQNFTVLPAADSGDRGLIGIAFDPDFLNNHWVYFYYTNASDFHNYLVRFDASSDTGTNGPVILYQTQDASFQLHVGGTVRFGTDGKIYLSIGDNGFSPNSQDLTNPHGKILRLNKDGTVPSDNPFVNSFAQPEIYAYGFRNPFRFSFDSVTGKMYEGDVGEATWEEINQVVAGKNYGWPSCEGLCNPTQPQFADPIYTYSHSGGSNAVMVGPIYHGQMFPADYQGKLFFGDYAAGFIKTINTDGSNVQNFDTSAGSVVDMQVDPHDGSIYFINYYPGQLYRITYSTGVQVPTSNATADKVKGVSPLTINFSSQGSNDPNGLPLTYSWDFGDGTTSTSPNPVKTYSTNGKFIVQLTVSNGTFSSLANPIVVQVGIAPTVTIGQPTNGTTYQAGDSFTVTASAIDGAGFDISDGSLSTTIVFHHQTHIHPFLGPLIGRTHTFTIPTTGEVSPDTSYEIDITATDTNGLSTTAVTNIFPRKADLTFNNMVGSTQIPGLQILLDGIPTTTPVTITGVVNFWRLLSAPFLQQINGTSYTFDHWSDNGGVSHYISTPATGGTFTAFFRSTTPYSGQYFNNKNLTGSPVITRQDPNIDFEWNTSPGPGLSQSNFSARWTKTENFPAGLYKFTTSTDDGTRLYLDGNLLIDQWHDMGVTSYSATSNLTAGNHTVVMEYFQSGGGAIATLVIEPAPIGPPPSSSPTATPQPTATPTPNPSSTPTPSPSPLPSATPTPQPPVQLGGLNLGGYCTLTGQSVDLENNIWNCLPTNQPIDMNKACQWQYNNPNAVGIQLDPSNPYTWQCFANQSPSPTPSPTPTPTPSPTPSPTPKPTTTPSPSPTPTPNPTTTPTPKPSATPSPTPTPTPTGSFTGQYFNNKNLTGNPVLTRQDPNINFNWTGNQTPDPKIGHNNFSIRWTKTQTFTAGSYKFHLTADDGIRFFIDNKQIFADWTDHALRPYDPTVNLTNGSHVLKIEYYQNSGVATVSFQQL